MNSWWEMGEHTGYSGNELAVHQIVCPFCDERGNFQRSYHAEKKKPNSSKHINFDTLECGNCKGYVQVIWSASSRGIGGEGVHDFHQQPWPLKKARCPEHWPANVGRYWQQASNNLAREEWDGAAVLSRSALQVAVRDHKAAGQTLKAEIEDLAKKGILPGIMKEWSDHVRILGNESAHPRPGCAMVEPRDAQDIFRFLTFFLQYLYDLPKQINDYRSRR